MATGIPSYKVILCGEYGAGKSSIFRRFLDNSFTENAGPRSTIGLDHIAKLFKVGNKSLKVHGHLCHTYNTCIEILGILVHNMCDLPLCILHMYVKLYRYPYYFLLIYVYTC